MSTKINCPECNHEFDIQETLAHQLEHKLRSEFANEAKANKKILDAENEKLKHQIEAFELQKQENEQNINQRVKEQESILRKTLRDELSMENAENLKLMQEKIQTQQDSLSTIRKEKLLFEQQLAAIEQREKDMELEIQEKVLAAKKKVQEEVQKSADQKHYLELKQRDELVETLKKQMDSMKRKAEQGSMQSQGEILEMEIEILLNNLYPMDIIDEVKKGVNGADCVHHVKSPLGKEVGVIAVESKRTQSFSENWIEKLKGDMRIHKADIGVIVTETMPKDMSSFGLRDGIWICKFSEIEGLSKVLRQSLLKIGEIKSANDNRGDKMQVLYDFLISEEFKQQMEAIVRGFSNMKNSLESEKRAMKRIWKQREKELDLIIDGATEMHGSIRGIAGNDVPLIKELELGFEFELLEE